MEFLLVCIFLHLDRIRRDTAYLSVFSPNAGKCGPEKTPYSDTFHVVRVYRNGNVTAHVNCVNVLSVPDKLIYTESKIWEDKNVSRVD